MCSLFQLQNHNLESSLCYNLFGYNANLGTFRNIDVYIFFLYQPLAAWLILTKTEISIKEIHLQATGLGLIGPGNGRLTKLLEILFGWCSTFRLRTLHHDLFGRIYLKAKRGPDYTYVFRNCLFKGSPIFGHLTGH